MNTIVTYYSVIIEILYEAEGKLCVPVETIFAYCWGFTLKANKAMIATIGRTITVT